jgi:hypothetical protein
MILPDKRFIKLQLNKPKKFAMMHGVMKDTARLCAAAQLITDARVRNPI